MLQRPFAFTLALLLSLGLGLGLPARAALDAQRARALFDATGGDIQINALGAGIEAGLMHAAQGGDAPLDRALAEVLREAFAAERLTTVYENALADTFTETDAQTTLAWYGSALGKKFLDTEQAAADPALAERMDAWYATTGKPPEARIERANRLVIATHGVDAMRMLIQRPLLGIARGLAVVDRRDPDEVEKLLHHQWQMEAVQVSASLHQTAIAVYIHQLREFSDAEFDELLTFFESEAGQRAVKGLDAALAAVMEDVGYYLETNVPKHVDRATLQ